MHKFFSFQFFRFVYVKCVKRKIIFALFKMYIICKLLHLQLYKIIKIKGYDYFEYYIYIYIYIYNLNYFKYDI